jgi:putative endonuclease
MFFVYVLRSLQNDSFYVGYTHDLRRRIVEHQSGRSHFTKKRGPWELVYVEVFSTRSEAMKREAEIKGRKSKRYIKGLVDRSAGGWRKILSDKSIEVG